LLLESSAWKAHHERTGSRKGDAGFLSRTISCFENLLPKILGANEVARRALYAGTTEGGPPIAK
jgi:hypothetical protein